MGTKLIHIFLGSLFVTVGMLIAVAGTLAALQKIFIVPLIALPVSAISMTIGFITIRAFPYVATCDSAGLNMLFVFRQERVFWEQVERYKNIGAKGRFFAGPNIWILMEYRIAAKDGISQKKAILLLPSLESSYDSLFAKDYTTELDQHIPNRRNFKKTEARCTLKTG